MDVLVRAHRCRALQQQQAEALPEREPHSQHQRPPAAASASAAGALKLLGRLRALLQLAGQQQQLQLAALPGKQLKPLARKVLAAAAALTELLVLLCPPGPGRGGPEEDGKEAAPQPKRVRRSTEGGHLQHQEQQQQQQGGGVAEEPTAAVRGLVAALAACLSALRQLAGSPPAGNVLRA